MPLKSVATVVKVGTLYAPWLRPSKPITRTSPGTLTPSPARPRRIPSHKDDYAKLNKEWHAKEDQLESKIKETSAKTENLPYAATESVAWYLADDLKMTDATPKGYAQASANESEPTPADIKDFQDTLKAGPIKMLVFNSQEANSTTDQITGAAKDANVPIVELTEQMPKQYTNLLDWMSALVDQFAAAVK